MRKPLCFLVCLLLTGSMSLTAQAANAAPIPENLKLETYRGVTMAGQLRATDPEGDELTYKLCTPPVKGSIVLQPDGAFTYTPEPKKWGKDYFGYTASDSAGNISHEATVIISLRRPKTKVFYQDMTGHRAQYAAMHLAQEKLFLGEVIGRQSFFQPDRSVTCGEFATLCSVLAGCPVSPAETESLHSPITLAQASVLLAEALPLHTASAMACSQNTPSWALDAMHSLTACRILSPADNPDRLLTRSDAALLLSGALDFRRDAP